MAEIRPFRGIRYNPRKAGDLSLNVCPPFDVITPALQRDLYERSEYNIVRLELARRGLGDDPYASAAETQRGWVKSGALQRDEEPSVYVTEESFTFRGRDYVRRGFVTAVRIEEYDRSIILPHENTRPEWVADRVRLMEAAKSNYSPLLVLFRDDLRSSVGAILRAVAGGDPTAVANPPDMPSMRMWRVTDPGTLEVLARTLADSQVFIADGHHRYEAAMRYRSRIRSDREVAAGESINHRMMLLVSVDEPGLMTRGYHRTVEGASGGELEALRQAVREQCDVEPWTPPPGATNGVVADAFAEVLGERQGSEVMFGVIGYGPGSYHIARLKSPPPAENALQNSEYSRVHDLVLRRAFSAERENEVVSFQHDTARVMECVRQDEVQMAFIMRPVPMSEFIGIVTRGWRLPPKATNFYPKPPAGSVIQTLEGEL
ncbi:MAG: DUF1015 domain-containing protein [Dehalococcoidia bacterium]